MLTLITINKRGEITGRLWQLQFIYNLPSKGPGSATCL